MKVVAVIPARYGSTRLPGKPLLRATGKYLIQHVYERVCQASGVEQVIVATDDERIVDAVCSFGGTAVMTRPDHASGTDRVAEVAAGLEAEIIVNVQGDEPEIDPQHVERVADVLACRYDCRMATLACPFPADLDPRDPNAVKVVVDLSGCALYFSRSVIPYSRDDAGVAACDLLLHLGIYAYRRRFLLEYARWPRGRLERLEKLEQLRVLERGEKIAVGIVEQASRGIDTRAEYEAFVARWRRSAG